MINILEGDCRSTLATLPAETIHCCVTSPPYFGLRDYGKDGQIGLEQTPDQYVAEMVKVFREVHRVLREDGTLWLNLGDSYSRAQESNVPQTKNPRVDFPIHTKAGSSDGFVGRGDRPGSRTSSLPPKNLIGIPWRVAFALQEDGWYLRQDIIWAKSNPMPESVQDRCTRSHEYIFQLSKSPKYYYDSEAIKEDAVSTDRKKWTDGGSDKQRGHGRRHAGFNGRYAEQVMQEGAPSKRNKRDVWTVGVHPYKGAHFATFPPKLIEPCILAGCPQGGTVLDPFGGSGTTGMVANQHGRNAVLCELNPAYIELARERCGMSTPDIDIED